MRDLWRVQGNVKRGFGPFFRVPKAGFFSLYLKQIINRHLAKVNQSYRWLCIVDPTCRCACVGFRKGCPFRVLDRPVRSP